LSIHSSGGCQNYLNPTNLDGLILRRGDQNVLFLQVD
jgi:hypothetical protein